MERQPKQFRLQQPEQSASARYKMLIRSLAAIAQHDPERWFFRLASELRQVVSFYFIGIIVAVSKGSYLILGERYE